MYITYDYISKDKIHVLLKEPFLCKGHILCNTLKHIITNDILTYAIEIVTVNINDSIITDDILSHRLGLIPIKLDPKLHSDISEIDFELDTIYDHTKAIDSIQTIYSSNLKPITNNVSQIELFKDIIDPNFPLFIIKKGQRVKLTAKAVIDTGYSHAKWSPVCAPTFYKTDSDTYLLKIESNGSKDPVNIYNEAIDVLGSQLENIYYSI